MTDVKTAIASPAADFDTAPLHNVKWLARVASGVRYSVCLITTQNPALWKWWKGRQNPFADMEGPYYLFGAPSRQLENGKAVIASIAELKEHKPYLLKIRIRGPKGEPVKNAKFDWWQASTAGDYSFNTYNLRGKFKSDENGDVEVLSVTPGKYGPGEHKRAGHFHFILTEPSGKYKSLTSQLYVCRANDTEEMKSDFLNFVRESRPINMLRSWSTNDEKFMELPPLDADEAVAHERLAWWNAKLEEWKVDTPIIAGAEAEIRLTA